MQIGAVFTRNSNDFVLTDLLQRETISDGLTVNSNVRELVYRGFNNQREQVYYWSLPKRFLGDKVSVNAQQDTYSETCPSCS